MATVRVGGIGLCCYVKQCQLCCGQERHLFYALNLFLLVKISNQSAPVKDNRNFVFDNENKVYITNFIMGNYCIGVSICNLNLKLGKMFFNSLTP